MKKIRKMMWVFVIAALLLLSGCAAEAPVIEQEEALQAQVEVVEAEEAAPVTEEAVSEVESEEIVTVINPLTNLPVEQSMLHRPIAVMLDNHGAARPQSSVADADIVIEMPVEGGYSRLMAIFTTMTDIDLGPIRSARPCFLDRAMELNCIYVHCGGSDRAYADIRNEDIEDIDQATAETGVFWRSNHRNAPHNVYTTLEKLAGSADLRDYENNTVIPTAFSFADETYICEDESKMVKEVDMYLFEGCTVQYEYNPKDNLYYRYVNQKPYIDEATGQQVAVSNIIFQSVNTKRDDGSYDGYGRTIVYSIGEGEGCLLSGGGNQPLNWAKEDRYEITEYTDEEGKPIELNSGKTWVHVLERIDTVRFDGKIVLE